VIELKLRGLVELAHDLPLHVERVSWDLRPANLTALPSGRYIVKKVSDEEVILAPADWDKNFNVTFMSSQHVYAISAARQVKKLRRALYMMGPKEWSPKRKSI
jgi:hypothetical protein